MAERTGLTVLKREGGMPPCSTSARNLHVMVTQISPHSVHVQE